MSILLIVIIVVVVIGVIPAMIIGFVLTKDGMARQKRISQMKRFRRERAGRQAPAQRAGTPAPSSERRGRR